MERTGHLERALFGATVGLLAVGGAGVVVDAPGAADAAWIAGTLLGLIASIGWTVAGLRAGRVGVDIIAVLALAGALLTDEYFAGAVIAVMLATGQVLDAQAERRARRDLSLLVERAPTIAHVVTGGTVVDVPVEQVARGDTLLVGAGEVVPVDGRLLEPAVLDESTLTGEAAPVEHPAGEEIRSGTTNSGGPTTMTATALAADSTYAAIVRLVEEAQASSAPFVRFADRIAAWFVPFTLLLAGAAWWVAGDATRAVAVLVVATPCPLLLAAPIAIMSGVSRAARIGVVVKGGGALEALARGRILLFDKTGTLTRGRPELVDTVIDPRLGDDAETLLRLAAGLDQVSPHPLAGALVTAARQRGLPLDLPTDVVERHGYGIEGTVDGRRVRLGKSSWLVPAPPPAWARAAHRRSSLDGSLTVFAGLDSAAAGAFMFSDPIRPDAPRMIRALRDAGIERTVLVTGDRAEAAETVGRLVGVDAVESERDPAEKLAVVAAETQRGRTIMVGDGVNDAPALAAASVGVAVAAQGSTASSQAADVVLTVDRLDRLADAILIAKRSRGIAVQAVGIGMGLSLVAMVVAAAGLLPPAAGALTQEAIDVLAVAWALRAVRPGREHRPRIPVADAEAAAAIVAEHHDVLAIVERLRTVADSLDTGTTDLAAVRELHADLAGDLMAHERAEEEQLLPIMARVLGGTDPLAAISRTHAEIDHQISRLGRMLDALDDTVPDEADVVELRRRLYTLYGVLKLHNAQEEEGLFTLLPDPA